MNFNTKLGKDHIALTRRYFTQMGITSIAGISTLTAWPDVPMAKSIEEWQESFPYLTPDEEFINYGRGNPPPYKLPLEKRREVGLTRETWQMEVIADPESDTVIESPLTKAENTAFTWQDLMDLVKTKSVRYMSAVSCTNGRKPCGMGLWEGVPLREVVWKVNPQKNIRRVFYYGYHNNDPKQRFQSSLTFGRVLEDPPGLPPVILCYKLNDKWLTPIRGGPVRMIVPELYANKSVKWLQHIVLTNNYKLNDTYALWNNDTESHLKTWACFVHIPKTLKAGEPLLLTGMAQAGMSGLHTVQYCLHPQSTPLPTDDPTHANAEWKEAKILPPPKDWGENLPDGLPPIPHQFNSQTNQPREWPLQNTLVHWAAIVKDVPPGKYDILCRTIDKNGVAQPMPRPYLKSGYNKIQKKEIIVKA